MGKSLLDVYHELYSLYGPQGWWPLLNHKGINPTKTGSMRGYHPKDYDFPKNEREKFEICIGAILAQNTNWVNVEKALDNMQKENAIDPKKMQKMDEKELGLLIRPAGYFNQKAKKLKLFSKFFIELEHRVPKRGELLHTWGIGPETADSILLYAYKEPIFVVDAYTKRIFSKMGFFEKGAKYEQIREMFEKNLPKDYKLYQEFHALIVEHAKNAVENYP
ncbi:MAG: endonuclease III domain-containing protein [Candidatus Micrarchaeia archaeon]